jgi:endo-1,4-beta-xylanase
MKYFIYLFGVFFFYSCSTNKKPQNYGLKDYYKTSFKMGVAINANQIQEKDILGNPLILKEFNSITPENILKSEKVHPRANTYDFKLPDLFAEYGQKNDLFIVGHTMIWHSQLTEYVKNIRSKDSLLAFMQNHITKLGERYDGKIQAWDVINEALEEDGSYRKSVFYNVLGEDYITESFRLAQKATPKAELYYNDYNIEQPEKRAGAIRIIKKIKEAGLRIDGVGIQGHWNVNKLPLKDIEDSIIEFAKLGVKVHITELDLSMLPSPWDLRGADVNQNYPGSPFMNPYPDSLPQAKQLHLANQYDALFRLFLKHEDKIDRVTFWGVADGNSWLNGWPIKGRTNYPLLFDKNYQPKPAYHKVMQVKTTQKSKEITP